VTVWGIVGPARVVHPSGVYSKLYLLFILGAVGLILVWVLHRRFKKVRIKLIVFPNILFGALPAPPAILMYCWSWFAISILFSYFADRRCKGWWAKYNYIYTGVGAMARLTSVAVQMKGINCVNWWGIGVG